MSRSRSSDEAKFWRMRAAGRGALTAALVCLLWLSGAAYAQQDTPAAGQRTPLEPALRMLAEREPDTIIAALMVGKSPSSAVRPPPGTTADELLRATATAVDLPGGGQALVLTFPPEPRTVPLTDKRIDYLVQWRLGHRQKYWLVIDFLETLTPEQHEKLRAGDYILLAELSAEQRADLPEAEVFTCDWEVKVDVQLDGRRCDFEWTPARFSTGPLGPPPTTPDAGRWAPAPPGGVDRWLRQPAIYRTASVAPRIAKMAGRQVRTDEAYRDVPIFLSVPHDASAEDVLRAVVAATGSEWRDEGPIVLLAPPMDPVARRVHAAELDFSERLLEASRTHAPGLYDRFPVDQIDFAAAAGFVPYIDLSPDVQREIRYGIRRMADQDLAEYTWRRGGYDGAIVRFELTIRLAGKDEPREGKMAYARGSLWARTRF